MKTFIKESINGIILAIIFGLILGFMVYGILVLRILEALCAIILLREIIINKKNLWAFVIIFVCVAFSVALAKLRSEDYPYDMPFVALSISLFIITKNFNLAFLKIALLAVSAFLLFLLFNVTDPAQLTGGIALFEGSGQSLNAISITMLSFTTVLYFLEYRVGETLSIWPSVITLVLSILSFCRTGTACSALLMAYVFYRSFRSGKNRFITVLFVVVLIVFAVIQFEYISAFFESMNNKSTGGYVENARFEILKAFIQRFDLEALVFGIDLNTIPAIAFRGNPHNSFIRIISNSGFVFLIYLFFFINASIMLFKNDKPLFVLFVIVLLRAWTDTMFGGTIYDFVLYLFVLYPFFKQQKIVAKNESRAISNQIPVSNAVCS